MSILLAARSTFFVSRRGAAGAENNMSSASSAPLREKTLKAFGRVGVA
jgi:hypothetical protein